MFQTILIGLSLVVLSAIGFVLFKRWRAQSLRQEEFQNSLKAAAAPAPPAVVIPEPAPIVALTPPAEVPRVTTPAGPNPPNALSPSKKVTFSPDAAPADPFDELNGETPMRDSMRHPERSFGPGVENTGVQRSLDSGVSAETVQAGTSVFSPEFAQNGGEFMKGIGAHDSWGSDTYATA
jgi:hypothetical protein